MSNLGSNSLPFVDADRSWGHDGVWAASSQVPKSRLPMIVSDEVAELSTRFGKPVQRTFQVQADDYIYSYRFNRDMDRRAEVVFAIEDDAGQVWVHSKAHYPSHIFRLPTGGIHWHELVVEGLLREVKEETGQAADIVRFLGIIDYQFWHDGVMVPFVSYIFHLHAALLGCPALQHGEPISEFRAVQPTQIRQLAVNLRGLPGVRRAWGEWRALAHDLVYDTLLH